MDYSSTLSNNAIIVIIVVVIIIIAIIILIAVFNNNNNNNNNNDGSGPVLMSKIDENKGKLDVIIDNQNKQTEIISDIINSLNDLSSNKSNRFSINENNNNGNDDITSSLINDNEIFNEISSENKKLDNDSSSILYDDKKSDNIDDREVVYYHEDKSLNTSEVEKLDLSNEFKSQDFQPQSIDFQHESFSETTESFTGQSIDEPSIIKKDLKFSDFNIHNQKIPVKDKSPQKKISIPLPKAKLPVEGVSSLLPKSPKFDHILNSDLSSPDDETILRVNKKIPLPKNHNKK
jgi:hypothetical protein